MHIILGERESGKSTIIQRLHEQGLDTGEQAIMVVPSRGDIRGRYLAAQYAHQRLVTMDDMNARAVRRLRGARFYVDNMNYALYTLFRERVEAFTYGVRPNDQISVLHPHQEPTMLSPEQYVADLQERIAVEAHDD